VNGWGGAESYSKTSAAVRAKSRKPCKSLTHQRHQRFDDVQKNIAGEYGNLIRTDSTLSQSKLKLQEVSDKFLE
jgi:hypothetical protein